MIGDKIFALEETVDGAWCLRYLVDGTYFAPSSGGVREIRYAKKYASLDAAERAVADLSGHWGAGEGEINSSTDEAGRPKPRKGSGDEPCQTWEGSE